MSKNWLFIRGGKVVQILNQEETPNPDQATEEYDTLAQDDSLTFKLNDDFTAELQLEYNREIWKQMGWISDEPIETNS